MPPSPRAAGARKRPLETRRFRAIRSRPRIRGIILKCPGLSLDRGRDRDRDRERERERERERKERGKKIEARRRGLMHRNVLRLAISRGRRFISSVPTREGGDLYTPLLHAATSSEIARQEIVPIFQCPPRVGRGRSAGENLKGRHCNADTRVTHASAKVTRRGYLLLEESRRRSAKMLASADRILIRRRYSSDERTPRLRGGLETGKWRRENHRHARSVVALPRFSPRLV